MALNTVRGKVSWSQPEVEHLSNAARDWRMSEVIKANLDTIPVELALRVFDMLPEATAVCLGLTCRRLYCCLKKHTPSPFVWITSLIVTWIVMGVTLVVSGHVWDRAVTTVGAAGTFHQMAFHVSAFTYGSFWTPGWGQNTRLDAYPLKRTGSTDFSTSLFCLFTMNALHSPCGTTTLGQWLVLYTADTMIGKQQAMVFLCVMTASAHVFRALLTKVRTGIQRPPQPFVPTSLALKLFVNGESSGGIDVISF
jgi:hypothetical protein